ncbi:lipase family protein, partial [Serratia sp. IR-2025]
YKDRNKSLNVSPSQPDALSTEKTAALPPPSEEIIMQDISDTLLAKQAALVIYAWDMCSKNLRNLTPEPDERIAHDGWHVCGYISGNDDVDGHHLKEACYGYVARNEAGEFVAVIRGTTGIMEWIDDAKFPLKTPDAPFEGKVESGFYSIYRSMQYRPTNRMETLPLTAGITGLIGDNPLTVIGHSLGSALATYLALELSANTCRQHVALRAFASPRPGNQAFTAYAHQTMLDYLVVNYQHDVVPRLPLLGYSALPNLRMLNTSPHVAIAGTSTCSHHLISYIALLDKPEFIRVMAQEGTTKDNEQCARCVTFPAC